MPAKKKTALAPRTQANKSAATTPAAVEGSEPENFPLATPERRDVAMRNVTEAHELTSGPDGGGGGSAVGSHTLSTLLRFHPFTTFFCWLAHKQYPAAHRPETRVAAMREANPKFYWVCVTLDVIIGALAAIILVAAAAAVLYKTVWISGNGQPTPLPK